MYAGKTSRLIHDAGNISEPKVNWTLKQMMWRNAIKEHLKIILMLNYNVLNVNTYLIHCQFNVRDNLQLLHDEQSVLI